MPPTPTDLQRIVNAATRMDAEQCKAAIIETASALAADRLPDMSALPQPWDFIDLAFVYGLWHSWKAE